MFWCDEIAEKVAGPQTINDSKTPSGRVHVGALRGVLIHDAVFRTLKEKNRQVRFLYGVDDFDPVDELPAGDADYFTKYLGAPLCNVPPPPGSSAPDMAEHYISEFFQVFSELGIKPEVYRMRDVYRSGRFDESIDAILRQADVVRQVYKDVSNSVRPANWYPFQVICENCGRIGTTEVTDYDGKEVTYTCRRDLVKWAVGCGHRGKISPFSGKGKLPWKLEWVAKWRTFPVTIEGAGKDHTTRGGSRDVAGRCLQRLFGQEPPLNIPYEFFLVGGAKMSSSRGVGASAREMADLLPPQVLRFLMLRTQPNRPVNFSPDQESIVRLFHEYERYHAKVLNSTDATDDQKRVFTLSQVGEIAPGYCPEFEIVLTLLQMPHVNLAAEMERRKGQALTEAERGLLAEWVKSAQYWLDHLAGEDEKLTIFFEQAPSAAAHLSAPQRGFLHLLADALPRATWTPEALQVTIFDIARTTPIDQPDAFKAIYLALLGRESGPKAGNLLAFLDKTFLETRFRSLPFSRYDFTVATAIPSADLDEYLKSHRAEIDSINARAQVVLASDDAPGANGHAPLQVIEFELRLVNGRRMTRRIIVEPSGSTDLQWADAVVREMMQRHQIQIQLTT